jgi:hypothetical protein
LAIHPFHPLHLTNHPLSTSLTTPSTSTTTPLHLCNHPLHLTNHLSRGVIRGLKKIFFFKWVQKLLLLITFKNAPQVANVSIHFSPKRGKFAIAAICFAYLSPGSDDLADRGVSQVV